MKTMIPECGQVIAYVYDPSLGRLSSIQQGTNTFTYSYDGISPLIQSLTRPNGSITEYQYNDPLKRLTRQPREGKGDTTGLSKWHNSSPIEIE